MEIIQCAPCSINIFSLVLTLPLNWLEFVLLMSSNVVSRHFQWKLVCFCLQAHDGACFRVPTCPAGFFFFFLSFFLPYLKKSALSAGQVDFSFPPPVLLYAQTNSMCTPSTHTLLIISALSSFLLSASLPLSDAWKQTQQTSRMPARQGILGNPGCAKAGGGETRKVVHARH